MQIKDAMVKNVQYVPPKTSLKEAAQCMVELDCGFLPISDPENGKLLGVITDRDIVIRAIADGFDPDRTTVGEIMTDKALCCFADDEVEIAADGMRDQCVYRLLVLNNQQEKKLCGVISLGDIVRHDELRLAGRAAKGITASRAA